MSSSVFVRVPLIELIHHGTTTNDLPAARKSKEQKRRRRSGTKAAQTNARAETTPVLETFLRVKKSEKKGRNVRKQRPSIPVPRPFAVFPLHSTPVVVFLRNTDIFMAKSRGRKARG